MLGLRTHGDVTLVVADTAVALADLIDFGHGAYGLDTAAQANPVDAAGSLLDLHSLRSSRRLRRRGASTNLTTKRRQPAPDGQSEEIPSSAHSTRSSRSSSPYYRLRTRGSVPGTR